MSMAVSWSFFLKSALVLNSFARSMHLQSVPDSGDSLEHLLEKLQTIRRSAFRFRVK